MNNDAPRHVFVYTYTSELRFTVKMSHRLYYNLFWDNNQNVCVLCKGERYTGFSLLFCDNHIIN